MEILPLLMVYLLLDSMYLTCVLVSSENSTSMSVLKAPYMPGLLTTISTEQCYGFPEVVSNRVWTEPTPVDINISCPVNTQINIQRASYMRPNIRGDLCISGSGCYLDSCCCNPWTESYCQVDMEENFSADYALLQTECQDKTQCEIESHAPKLDGMCVVTNCDSMDPQRREQRCWARWIRVIYTCTGEQCLEWQY